MPLAAIAFDFTSSNEKDHPTVLWRQRQFYSGECMRAYEWNKNTQVTQRCDILG